LREILGIVDKNAPDRSPQSPPNLSLHSSQGFVSVIGEFPENRPGFFCKLFDRVSCEKAREAAPTA
jgi:hypothetical protein